MVVAFTLFRRELSMPILPSPEPTNTLVLPVRWFVTQTMDLAPCAYLCWDTPISWGTLWSGSFGERISFLSMLTFMTSPVVVPQYA